MWSYNPPGQAGETEIHSRTSRSVLQAPGNEGSHPEPDAPYLNVNLVGHGPQETQTYGHIALEEEQKDPGPQYK